MSISTVTPHVDDAFLARQRAELGARRASYREQVERLDAAAEELADGQEAPDLGDDEGFAEAHSLTVERDRLLALQAVARSRVDQVDAALRRLDAGAYGACRSCRRPIPVVRLESVPEATECVGCASGSALRRRNHP